MTESGTETSPIKSHSILRLSMGLVNMVLWIAILFTSAGQLRWARGWICSFVYVGSMLVTGCLTLRSNPSLLAARAQWKHSNTKPFDKVFLMVLVPLTFVQPVVAGLDAVRFRWSSQPFWTLYLGIMLFLPSVTLIAWTLVSNPYAEVSVRIQSERGHRVVRSGPYRFVRHPMYLGSIIMFPALAWMLGSDWALAVALAMVFSFIVRTSLEDQTLCRELPEYVDFSATTRYRLFPGLW